MSDYEEFNIDSAIDEIAEEMENEEIDDNINDEEEVKDGVREEKQETTETENVEQPKGESKQEPVISKPAPTSWSKEHHEDWNKIPKEAQDYIEIREKQMLDGIDQYKDGYRYGEQLSRAIDPYRDILQNHGVDEVTAITNLFNHHIALTDGPLETRQQAFVELGQSLGLIPSEGQQRPDPATQALNQRLARIEQQEKQREHYQQEQAYKHTLSEVEAFAASPEAIYFDEVADDVVMLIGAGMSLKDAYKKAVWSNPITRAKEQAKLVEQKITETKQKNRDSAIKAKKASSNNMRPANKSRVTEQPSGSWDDTMDEVIFRLNNS